MPVGKVLFGIVFCLLDLFRYEIAGWVIPPAISLFFVDAACWVVMERWR